MRVWSQTWVNADGGETICESCLAHIVSKAVESRYAHKNFDINFLETAWLEELWALQYARTEKRLEKAQRRIEKLLGFRPIPLTYWEEDSFAEQAPFEVCSECGEALFPEYVEDILSKEKDILEFQEAAETVFTLFDKVKIFFHPIPLIFFLRNGNFVPVSHREERILKNYFINDRLDGISFFEKGKPGIPLIVWGVESLEFPFPEYVFGPRKEAADIASAIETIGERIDTIREILETENEYTPLFQNIETEYDELADTLERIENLLIQKKEGWA